MSNLQSGTIGCKCGKCEITVADKRAVQYFRCGCEDCRQGLEWARIKGGDKLDQLPHLYYIPADITSVKGKDFMEVYKLRCHGRSTRLYCGSCYSLMGVEHPNYQSNVFLIFPKHCQTDCDLSVSLTAIICMIDYPEDYNSPPEDEVPLFYSREFKQEQKRWSQIPLVATNFKPRTQPLKGISFTQLIEDVGPPTILNLEKGKRLM